MSQFPVSRLPRVVWNTDEGKAALAQKAPRIPWDKFTRTLFQPVPGEHVAIVGPTGQGKTVLQNNILPLFPFVAVFVTKPRDESMERLIREGGYTRLAQWHPLNPIDHPRRVIWPDASYIGAEIHQRKVFGEALDKIFREGGRPLLSPVGWAVAIDELWYIVNVLNLEREIKVFLLQARSLGHSLILATQRPKSVPLEVYDQSTHLFFFRDNDYTNLQRLSEINSRDSSVVRMAVANLEAHQTLYVNTRTGMMARTHAPAPRKG